MRGAVAGTRSTLTISVVLAAYVVGGVAFRYWGSFAPSYPFLSLTEDPVFVIGITLCSLTIVTGTASMILYYLLTGAEDDRSQFVILVSFIGLGFGAASLKTLFSPFVKHLQTALTAIL